MKTPFGQECPYFYGDYYRGREREECRLLPKGIWQKALCETCPLPAIRRANACSHMILKGVVRRDWRQAFRKQVVITAWCEKSNQKVDEPEIGCGQCHPLDDIFKLE